MKKIFLFIILLFTLSACSGQGDNFEGGQKTERASMNICWFSPTGIPEAIESQLVAELKVRNIDADLRSIKAEEAVKYYSGEWCDVVFADDSTVAVVVKAHDDWRIIGRTSNFRVGLVTPFNSSLKTFIDLKGKTIGTLLSGVRFVRDRAKENNMNMLFDLDLLAVDKAEMRNMVVDSKGKEWGKFDAFIMDDPLLAYVQAKSFGKLIAQDYIVMSIVTRNKYIQNNPEVVVNFFKAFAISVDDLRANMITEKKIVIEGLSPDFYQEVGNLTFNHEDNFDEERNKSLRFNFNKDEINILQNSVDMVFDFPFAKPRINILDYIDLSFMEKAMEREAQE